jgi:hypothetical protein
MLNQNKQIETPKIKFLFLLFSGIGTKKINLDSSPPYNEHSTTIKIDT